MLILKPKKLYDGLSIYHLRERILIVKALLIAVNLGLIHLEKLEQDVSPEREILRKKTQGFLHAAKEIFESMGSSKNLIQCNTALKNCTY